MADQRTPWIGVSQYKKPREYNAPTIKEESPCTFTCVMPDKDEFHSIVKTHRCSLYKGHLGNCICICNFEFQGF